MNLLKKLAICVGFYLYGYLTWTYLFPIVEGMVWSFNGIMLGVFTVAAIPISILGIFFTLFIWYD